MQQHKISKELASKLIEICNTDLISNESKLSEIKHIINKAKWI